VLADEVGDELLLVENGGCLQIELRRPLPLPLLVMVTMRIVEESQAPSALERPKGMQKRQEEKDDRP
jgi:hypothetical protein